MVHEHHSLFDYLSDLNSHQLVDETDITDDATGKIKIEQLTYDDRTVSGATLFVCKGIHFKEDYLADAVKKGAVAYVSEKKYDGVACPCIKVKSIRSAMVFLSKLFFNDAPDHMTSIGITGTKGKSTTAYYIKNILDLYYGKECAILSSIDNYDGVVREESHLTTPESIELFRHFQNAIDSGIDHLVMEVSSQALKYDRVAGLKFDIACFTNIGRDHISSIEHPDFDDYLGSKLKIFNLCRYACINTDMEYFDKVMSGAEKSKCKIMTYGTSDDNDVVCLGKESSENGISFRVKTKNWEEEFKITMPGLFNVENALCAIAVSSLLGIPVEYMKKGLLNARAPGRMERFTSKDGRIIVLVDYAHNKMSFKALFESSSLEYPGKTKIAVFGCPGGKAQLRRKDLGETAGSYCKLSILTEEDAGEEPVGKISSEISSYVSEVGGKYMIIDDRGEAIKEAILENGTDKIIFITGKGRETRQKRGVEYVDTPSDVDYTLKYLREYDDKNA